MIDLNYLTKYSKLDFVYKKTAYILSLILIGVGAPLAFSASRGGNLETSSVDLNTSLAPLINGASSVSTGNFASQLDFASPTPGKFTSVSVSAQNNSVPKVKAVVDGQQVNTGNDGSFHKEIRHSNGKTEIDVSVTGNSGVTDQSTNSTSIQINSQTYSSGSEYNDVEGRQ